MKRGVYFFLCGIILLCFSCSQEKKPARLVASKGLPSELLVIVDKAIMEGDVADTIKEITQGSVPGLMQNEPYFRVSRILSNHYVQRYTTMHSKLFVRLDSSLKRSMLGVSHNVCACPQIEVTVAAPDIEALRAFLSINKEMIRQLLGDFQLEIRTAALKKQYNLRIDTLLRSTLGYSIHVPKEIAASKVRTHFLWAGTNRNEKDLNVVVYAYPWNCQDVFNVEDFAWTRDSVMQCNIPGERPDQWMQTTRVGTKPVAISCTRILDGKLVQEVRGLWEMRNGAMGGPFVSLVRVDTAQSQVIVAEGFVYSPSNDKRDLLRTVEAALRTLKKIRNDK